MQLKINSRHFHRSVRFVSLDTHPANNALVVTYEILAVVTDSQRGHELTKRTKRDQLLINISALDNLNERSLKKTAGGTALDLRQLSADIIKKCPMLEQRNEAQALEDIQLHLLYLLNRKRSQLFQAESDPDRPSSVASSRLKPASPSANRSRLSSARQRSARLQLDGRRLSLSSRNENSSSLDVYASLCERELKNGGGWWANSYVDQDELVEEFLEQFDGYLMKAEAALQTKKAPHQDPILDIESQIEGLYGELEEKLAAMVGIRRQVQDDQSLTSLQPNRLLISAMLRTLQDSDSRDSTLAGSILFCLVRFSRFEDIYERVFNQGEPIDMIRVVVELLEEHVMLATRADELRLILDNFYLLNALLVITNNSINLDLHSKSEKFRSKLIQQHGKRVANILVGLFVLISHHLARDVRNQSANKYERLTLVLAELIRLSQSLVVFREFVNLLKVKAQTLVESVISCLNTLQLCWPVSGATQQAPTQPGKQQQQRQATDEQQQFLVKDQLILCEIYGLEMDLLKLANSLMYDSRFKLRFIRKNLLLKCVLRNLVVFLASSRRSNTLAPFDRSSVLLVPFKCLYELSCQDSIKAELYKSKIITKCLFEYLLSTTADFKTLLDSLALSARQDKSALEYGHESRPIPDEDQISLEPNQATHYILATWVNLSAKKSAPFFGPEVGKELSEPLADYMDLAAMNLATFIAKSRKGTNELARMSQSYRDAELIVYIHAKLLRNLTQHLSFLQKEPIIWVSSYARWLEQLARSLHQLLPLVALDTGSNQTTIALTVECVGTITNLLMGSNSGQLSGELPAVPALDWPKELASILALLLEINLSAASNADGENDDLLLVSVNLLGALAKCREICNELKGVIWSIVAICNFILEKKSIDMEMTISCLFTLSQLVNHSTFLQAIGGSLEDERQEATLLVDHLSSLMMHSDMGTSKLASLILNTLKQFEEQRSLSDSVACKRRFVCYNEKWLNAIRANRDQPNTNGDPHEQDLNSAPLDRPGRSERELDMVDVFDQLQTVSNEESSSAFSASSSNRSSNMLDDSAPTIAARLEGVDVIERDNNESENENEPAGEVEDEEDEEETFSEPDLNVIDANSMIKHLTYRREFRSEQMLRR